MENSRLKCVLAAAATLGLSQFCYATGGDWFESPAKFSDTLEMLPGKSLGQIFLETTPEPPEAQEIDVPAAARALVGRLGHEPVPKLLKEADDWIAQARRQRDNSACNLAHDLHDAIAVSATDPAGAKDYILWRLDHAELADEKVEEHAESAKGPIKANWLFACGAASFSGGDRTECQEWFDRVLKEFPKSPRAELALFMQARCAFSASRAENPAPDDRKKAIALFEAYLKKYPQGVYKADALGWLGALAFDGENYLKALEYYIAQAEVPGHPETLPTAIYNCERALARVAPNPNASAAFDLVARHPRVAMAFAYLVLSAPEANNYDGKWDNPAEVKKWRRAMLPRLAAAVAKQKDSYKSADWQPRYLALLVQAASASGNQAQALQLSQISPDQLTKSDDLLFARAIALQRANKTPEAIELFQKFLSLFPKSTMRAGVSLRLALALQDNHQAGKALAVLCQLLPRQADTAEPASSPAAKDEEEDEEPDKKSQDGGVNLGQRYTDGDEYPPNETDWQMSQSSVYPNLSGADEDQVQQFMDALVNFAPLPELEAAIDDPAFDNPEKTELRAILAERFLAAEDFAKARNYAQDKNLIASLDRLQGLTNEANHPGAGQADKMVALGSAWSDLRGKVLRAPLGTRTSFAGRRWDYDPLTKRDNGVALRQVKVEDQLDDLDELHHAARWWMRAARLVPGTPVAAKARLLALETIPKIARASSYGETRAREIGAGKASREIYAKLRSESPQSLEASEAAFWSIPDTTPLHEHDAWSTDMPVRYLWPYLCPDNSATRGYPFSDGQAFEKLASLDPNRNDERGGSPQNLEDRVKALRNSSKTLPPPELLKEVQSLAADLRSAATGPEDAGGINCMEDLSQFLSEPGVTSEAAAIYANLRLDLLHRARAALPDPGIQEGTKDDDESVDAEIADAEKSKALVSVQDYLDFCHIGLVDGARFDVHTDIKDPKDPDNPVTFISRDYKKLQQMTQEFLKKYPQSKKREAALFVFARAVYGASCPCFVCVGVPLAGYEPLEGVAETKQVPYFQETFDSKKVFDALDEYERAYPNGRYAADVRNLRAATQWRSGQWENALKETIAQIKDQSHPELQSEAGVRLANIFAELTNPDHRPGVLAAIQANSTAIPFLQAYAAAAHGGQDHPLRYLQDFVADQFHIEIPKPAEDVAEAR